MWCRTTSKSQAKGSALAASQRIWLAQPDLRVPEGMGVTDLYAALEIRLAGPFSNWRVFGRISSVGVRRLRVGGGTGYNLCQPGAGKRSDDSNSALCGL